MTTDKPIHRGPGDLWDTLRCFTNARVGLGHTGVSLPTQHHLAFQLAHARARDAVHIPLDCTQLLAAFSTEIPAAVVLRSRALDRQQYLQRPDLGRRLHPESARVVVDKASTRPPPDLCVVVADGLSSTAVQKHAPPMLKRIYSELTASKLSVSCPIVVQQGRVAVGDEVGELLEAKLLVLMIGERPGLSAPDSLGIYYTYGPRVGLTDANRNCLSNIRPEGMTYDEAIGKLMWLIEESRVRKLSGVALKERSGESHPLDNKVTHNFLLGRGLREPG